MKPTNTKEEMIAFADWLCNNYTTLGSGQWESYDEDEPVFSTTEELYDKFKEETQV